MNLKKKNKIDKFLNENLFLEEGYNNIEFIKKDVLIEVARNEEKVNKLFERKGVRDSYYKNKNVFTTSENQYIRKIGEILYTLFNKNELSQHASGIYGELIELSPSLNNINDVLKQTTTYNWYKQMLENVNEHSNYNSNDIWIAARLFYKTKSHPNGYIDLTPYDFKEKFIKLSVKNLNVFYRKMMNAVELYFEEKNQ